MSDDPSTHQVRAGAAGSSQRYEFASPAWVDEVRSQLSGRLAVVDLTGLTASFSEEFSDPPAHLLVNAGRTVGWHYAIASETVAVHCHPLPGADRRILGDYATVAELARLRYADPAFGPLAQAALDGGKLRLEGDHEGVDPRVANALNGLHDALVDITA